MGRKGKPSKRTTKQQSNDRKKLSAIEEVSSSAAESSAQSASNSEDANSSSNPKTSKRKMKPERSLKKDSSESSQSDGEPLEKRMKMLNLKQTFELWPSGVVLAVGQGEFGQLGLGEDITTRKKPALVSKDLKDKRIKKVAAGGLHTVCLTEDHEVYTFGCNDEGSLGRVTSDDCEEYEPGLVGGVLKGVNVIDISAGDSHTVALSDSGVVYLWGSFRDSKGKLGLVGECQGSKLPVQIHSLKEPIVKIASGCDHVAMITDRGKVYTIGSAERGQLGRVARYFAERGGRRTADIFLNPRPVHLPKLEKSKQIASEVFCGIYSTYVLCTSGNVFAFGLNNYNQLGIPDEEDRYVPAHIPALSQKDWKMIAGGTHHLILLNKEGNVYGLGRAQYGRLGLGEDIKVVDEPTHIPRLKDIASVATGTEVSFAVDSNGKAYGWGMGTNLQLTTGEEDDELSPVELSGKNLEERSVIAVDGGGQHTVILACDRPQKNLAEERS